MKARMQGGAAGFVKRFGGKFLPLRKKNRRPVLGGTSAADPAMLAAPALRTPGGAEHRRLLIFQPVETADEGAFYAFCSPASWQEFCLEKSLPI